MNELEQIIFEHAERNGFALQHRSKSGQIIFYRESPAASTSLRLDDAEHAMLRSQDEFYRFLDKAFDK